MKRILTYLGKYKKESILGPLFKLLEASFELLIPLVVAGIVDTGIKNQDMAYILKMGGIMVLLGIIGLGCSLTAQYFAAKAAVGAATGLRSALFKHIQSLSYSELDKAGTSTMITRMTSDVNQVQAGINLVLRLFLRSPFIVVGAMVMAFTIDVKAAMIFVVTIPLLSLVVFGIMFLSIPLYRKVQARLDKVLLGARENLSGIRVIRAFNKEKDEEARFEQANSQLKKQQLFVGRISALMNPITYVIINGAIIILIQTGAWQVEGGILTQGAVMALVNYMSQILVELVKLANLIINVTKSMACANRIGSIFDMKPSVKDGKGIATPKDTDIKVCFDHVGLKYAGAGEETLTDICLRVKKGQTIGVIGGTGSGKTSLVNLIPRFYDITEGNLYIDGSPVSEYDLETLRNKIGIVPQRSVLFKGTIRENMLWGKEDATEEEILEALEAAQAIDFVKDKKDGLDTMIVQNANNLSGGQKQRLAIARALIRKPEILILDDSASALDYATDAKLRQAISNLDQQMTVFIVSQRTASIWSADQIIVLDDGKVAGIGTHQSLLNTCQVYEEIYYSQFPKEVTAHE